MAIVLTLVAARYYIFFSVNQRFTEKCGFDFLSTCSQNSFFFGKSFAKPCLEFFFNFSWTFLIQLQLSNKVCKKWFLLKHYTTRSIFSFILNQKLNVKVSSTFINIFNKVGNVFQCVERFTIFLNQLFIILVILVEYYTQNLPGCLLEI